MAAGAQGVGGLTWGGEVGALGEIWVQCLVPTDGGALSCVTGPSCKYKHRRRVMCANYLVGFCPEGPNCKFMQ